jgi:hypothetical protein
MTLEEQKALIQQRVAAQREKANQQPTISKRDFEAEKKMFELALAEEKEEVKSEDSAKDTAEAVDEALQEKIPDDLYIYDESTNSKKFNIFSIKRRKEIESRCSELDIGDILIKRRVEQKIPIIPNKFEILLRDTSAVEDTYIKNLLAKEYYERTEISQAYIQSKMARYKLTLSLLEINGVSLGDIKIKTEPATEAEEKEFKSKLEVISSYPVEIIQDIDLQNYYFKERIKSLTMGKIQNF